MKKLTLLTLLILVSQFTVFAEVTGEGATPGENSTAASGEYKIVVEGFDWGPAVNKVILLVGEAVTAASASDYQVFATRRSDLGTIPEQQASGSRTVSYAYVSDADGNRAETGEYVTLVLAVSPVQPIGSPIQYLRIDNQGRNNWIDYKLTVVNAATGMVWDTPTDKFMPLVDTFDLTGRFKYNDQLTMSYAAFRPETNAAKSPLIIWLHGGGEGGTDPTIPLLGNRAANYASDDIQQFFGGAYVLVPQCPGAWMHNAEGVTTHGRENDIYNEGLMALIRDYVKSNPKIDANRIYVGGCSNGGYMALKLILLYPNYFAAGFISSLAYQSEYITDQQLKRIKNVPIWFVHSKDDPVTLADKTVGPVYNRLKAAGAKNVHFSFYDHVTDITGFFGGDDYRYNGHWSWIYLHANLSRRDFDGSPVLVKGRPVTVMEWMAAQSR